MPPDDEWTDELAVAYEKTRKFFLIHKDKDCIPLFLNSFGTGEGLGLYQLVQEVFQLFSVKEMLLPLSKALHSEHESVRLRAAQAVNLFPDERLIKPLLWAIHHSAAPIRLSCYRALESIQQATGNDYREQILKLSEERLKKEQDKFNIEFLQQLKINLSTK